MSSDTLKDMFLIRDAHLLRKMWQETDDLGKKKEIRSCMYKLREDRSKDLHNSNVEMNQTKETNGSTHADSLADHSFMGLKSKEIRDAASPTREIHYKIDMSDIPPSQRNKGWNVETKNENSEDGKTRTTTTVASKAGSTKIDNGVANYAAKCEDKTSVFTDGDANNFTKSLGASTKSAINQEAFGGDENGKFHTTTSKTSSSSHFSTESRSKSEDANENLTSLPSSEVTDYKTYSKPAAEYVDGNTKVTTLTHTLPDGTQVTKTRYETVGERSSNTQSSSQKISSSSTSSKSSSTRVQESSNTYDDTQAVQNSIPSDVSETVTRTTRTIQGFEPNLSDSNDQARSSIYESVNSETSITGSTNRRSSTSQKIASEKTSTRAKTTSNVAESKTLPSSMAGEYPSDLPDNLPPEFFEKDTKITTETRVLPDGTKVTKTKWVGAERKKPETVSNSTDVSSTRVSKSSSQQSTSATKSSADAKRTHESTDTSVQVERFPKNEFSPVAPEHDRNQVSSIVIEGDRDTRLSRKSIHTGTTRDVKLVDEYVPRDINKHHTTTNTTATIVKQAEERKVPIDNRTEIANKYTSADKKVSTHSINEERRHVKETTAKSQQIDGTTVKHADNRKISVEVSPTHDAFVRSLRSVTPEREKPIKSSTPSVRSSTSPDKYPHDRRPSKASEKFSSTDTITKIARKTSPVKVSPTSTTKKNPDTDLNTKHSTVQKRNTYNVETTQRVKQPVTNKGDVSPTSIASDIEFIKTTDLDVYEKDVTGKPITNIDKPLKRRDTYEERCRQILGIPDSKPKSVKDKPKVEDYHPSPNRRSPEKQPSQKTYPVKDGPSKEGPKISEFPSQIRRTPEKEPLEKPPPKVVPSKQGPKISEFPSQIRRTPEKEPLEKPPKKVVPSKEGPKISEFPSQVRRTPEREPLEKSIHEYPSRSPDKPINEPHFTRYVPQTTKSFHPENKGPLPVNEPEFTQKFVDTLCREDEIERAPATRVLPNDDDDFYEPKSPKNDFVETERKDAADITISSYKKNDRDTDSENEEIKTTTTTTINEETIERVPNKKTTLQDIEDVTKTNFDNSTHTIRTNRVDETVSKKKVSGSPVKKPLTEYPSQKKTQTVAIKKTAPTTTTSTTASNKPSPKQTTDTKPKTSRHVVTTTIHVTPKTKPLGKPLPDTKKTKITRTTSDQVIKVQHKTPVRGQSKPELISPVKNTDQVVTTKSILINNDDREVVVNLQRSNSSREPSPDHVYPTPASDDDDDFGRERYPDEISEPDEHYRKKPARVTQMPIIETEEEVIIGRKVDKVDEADECLLSVDQKVKKFAPKPEEDEESRLSVSEKVSKFITTAEQLTTPRKSAARPKSPIFRARPRPAEEVSKPHSISPDRKIATNQDVTECVQIEKEEDTYYTKGSPKNAPSPTGRLRSNESIRKAKELFENISNTKLDSKVIDIGVTHLRTTPKKKLEYPGRNDEDVSKTTKSPHYRTPLDRTPRTHSPHRSHPHEDDDEPNVTSSYQNRRHDENLENKPHYMWPLDRTPREWHKKTKEELVNVLETQEIEEIYDLELLEELVEIAVSYEQRKRIRVQIKIVEELIREGKLEPVAKHSKRDRSHTKEELLKILETRVIEEIYELETLEELLQVAVTYEQRRKIRMQIRVVQELLNEEHRVTTSAAKRPSEHTKTELLQILETQEIENIYDAEILEELLEIVVSFEQRRRIKAQILVVEESISQDKPHTVTTKVVTTTSRSASPEKKICPKYEATQKITSPVTSMRRTTVTSAATTESQKKSRSKTDLLRLLETQEIEEIYSLEILEELLELATTYDRRRKIRNQIKIVKQLIAENKLDTVTSKKIPSRDTSPEKKETHSTYSYTETQQRSSTTTRALSPEKQPVWVTQRNLKKITDRPKPSKTSTSTTTTTGRKETVKDRKPIDVITSSYGVGPTDENGTPLFGLKALRSQNRTETSKTQGTVVRGHYYSENGNEPVGEVTVTKYSTDPHDFENTSGVKKHNGVVSVTTTKKLKGAPATKATTKITDIDIDQDETTTTTTTKTTKFTRRGSVKEISKKFIENAVETSKQEKQQTYPKAGLILRTSSLKRTAKSPSPKRESSPSTATKTISVRKSSKTDTFLNNHSRVKGVQDVIARMKNADHEMQDGDSIEDAEARTLLNKFIGSQVLLSGMESASTPSKTVKKTTTTTTTVNTGSGKPKTITRTFTHPINRKELDTVRDEETLKLLLERCTEFEERRIVRNKLRQVMAEQEVRGNVSKKDNGEDGVSSGRVEGESLLLPLLQGLLDAPAESEQTPDSGTESGEDFRSGLVAEVQNALAKLSANLESDSNDISPDRRSSLLQLVSKLQAGLGSQTPASHQERRSAGRFCRRKQRHNRHTVGVSSEELEDARRLMEEIALHDSLGTSSSLHPRRTLQKQLSEGEDRRHDFQSPIAISPNETKSQTRPSGSSTSVSQQSGLSSAIETPTDPSEEPPYPKNSISSSTVSSRSKKSSKGDAREESSEEEVEEEEDEDEGEEDEEEVAIEGSGSEEAEDEEEEQTEEDDDEEEESSTVKSPPKDRTPKQGEVVLQSNPLYERTSPENPIEPLDLDALNRYNARKMKMKRANTIDIPKPLDCYESEEEYENDDDRPVERSNGSSDPQKNGNGKELPKPPPFEPRTENDRKFVAFLNRHNDNGSKTTIWANAAKTNGSDSDWSSKFGNIKTAFEKKAASYCRPPNNDSNYPNAARNFWQSSDDAVAAGKQSYNGPKVCKQGARNLQQMFERRSRQQQEQPPPIANNDERSKTYKFLPQPLPINKFSHAPTSAFTPIPKRDASPIHHNRSQYHPRSPQTLPSPRSKPTAFETATNIIKTDTSEVDSVSGSPLFLYCPKHTTETPQGSPSSPSATPWTCAMSNTEHRVQKIASTKFENVQDKEPIRIKPQKLDKDKIKEFRPSAPEKLLVPFLTKSADKGTSVRKLSDQFDSISAKYAEKGAQFPVKHAKAPRIPEHQESLCNYEQPKTYAYAKTEPPKPLPVYQAQFVEPRPTLIATVNKPKALIIPVAGDKEIRRNFKKERTPKVVSQDPLNKSRTKAPVAKVQPQAQIKVEANKPYRKVPVQVPKRTESSARKVQERKTERPKFQRQSSTESVHEYEAAIAKVMTGPTSHQAVTIRTKSPQKRDEYVPRNVQKAAKIQDVRPMEGRFSMPLKTVAPSQPRTRGPNDNEKEEEPEEEAKINMKDALSKFVALEKAAQKVPIPSPSRTDGERKWSMDSNVYHQTTYPVGSVRRSTSLKKTPPRPRSLVIDGKADAGHPAEAVTVFNIPLATSENAPPIKPPSVLSRSDSWQKFITQRQQQNQPPPGAKPVARSKSSHSLAVPTLQFQAGMTKDEINQKKQTVESYFIGDAKPPESHRVAGGAIARKKTSEKVTITRHTSERVESTSKSIAEGPSVTNTTTTTQETRVSGRQQEKKPLSPFAKFRQLDKQNSLNTPGSPGTPTGSRPFFRFTDPDLNRQATTIKERLLRWCQSKTEEYENVQLDNFSSSWADGLAFCALIHHFYPDAFDYSTLTPENRRHNFTLAFRVADEKADIAPLLDVDDMVAYKKPDWKCVFTYVQTIYKRFKNVD